MSEYIDCKPLYFCPECNCETEDSALLPRDAIVDFQIVGEVKIPHPGRFLVHECPDCEYKWLTLKYPTLTRPTT